MRQVRIDLLIAAMVAAVFISPSYSRQSVSARQSQMQEGSPSSPTFIEFPLPANDPAYGAIDGKHIWQYVVEQAAISRHYRDQGHPQFWGRIIGTSGDEESAQWLLDKFKQMGMTDAHIQPLDLLPQWIPQSWDVTVTAGGKTLTLTSAQPYYATAGTQGQGLDLEVAYVGLGSEADFAGRDVRGKAVFVFSSQAGPLKRAADKGAAVIFGVNERQGNMKIQPYPTNEVRARDGKPEPTSYDGVTTFSLGMEDGQAVRNMIGQASAGQMPHAKIRLDVQRVPNLKTALVWGTLPGTTDETVYVEAHRDGWFDASGDNAGGVASMVGLAEYFAKIPQSQRRRTLIFIGVPGHHNTGPDGGPGGKWLIEHRAELFAKTALIINDEHPSNVEAPPEDDWYVPMEWYAGGPSRPELGKIAADAFREFGVTTIPKQSANPPGGDLYCAHCPWPGQISWYVPAVQASANGFFYFHTEGNTPETVPWTGLEAATRAYAKIIDQVNKLDLKDLQRPPETYQDSEGSQ